MRVLFTSLRNTSHFLPLVPFIEACCRHGHEVAVAAPPDLAERTVATGAAFMPFGHPGDEGLRPIWTRLRDASEHDARAIAIGELFAGVCARTALPELLATMQRWKPALVVRESQEYAALVAAEKLGIAHARAAITLRSTEAEVLAVAARAVDEHRASHGLAPDPAGERIAREPIVTQFPASLDRAPELAPVRRFRAPRKAAAPLPPWWGARREPFVYATFGTVTGGMDLMQSTYRLALDAVAELPLRVLLTVGAELPLELLGPIPANVHVERFVPQDEVLPHATAVLCHGGSGTVLGALAAGVPLVVAPLFADQPNNAERIAEVGAGLALPTRAATVDSGIAPALRGDAMAIEMRRALVRVTEEASFRTVAQRLAAEIAALPAIDDAPAELEQLARGEV